MKDRYLKNLTPEQIEKVKACKKPEELIELAKSEGIQLTDEQLAAISGGSCADSSSVECPICHSHDIGNKGEKLWCRDCNCTFVCWETGKPYDITPGDKQ